MEVLELNASIFIIPAKFGGRNKKAGIKNGEDRVVVLNRVARSVIDAQREKCSIFVFPLNGGAIHRMNNSAWDSATKRAATRLGLEDGKPATWDFCNLRLHDLKHTFGRRLRAVGVTLETRKVLLGHTNGDITTHYSGAELNELILAAEKVCYSGVSKPTLTLLRSANTQSHASNRNGLDEIHLTH